MNINDQINQINLTNGLLFSDWTDFELNIKKLSGWNDMAILLNNVNLNNSFQNDLFVKICKYILLYHPETVNSVEHVLNYNEIPRELARHLNIVEHHKLFDLLIVTKVNQFIPVQCIYKINVNNVINQNLISDVIKQNNGIFMTNCRTSNHSNPKDKFTIISKNFFINKLNHEIFKNMNINGVAYMEID